MRSTWRMAAVALLAACGEAAPLDGPGDGGAPPDAAGGDASLPDAGAAGLDAGPGGDAGPAPGDGGARDAGDPPATPDAGTMRCGDGVVQRPEACDDGERNGTYGRCAADCAGPGPRCGDGTVQPRPERCDDGALNGTYGHCRADCAGPGPRCGDRAVQARDGEECDLGAHNGQYDCTALCRLHGFPPPPVLLDPPPAEWLDAPPACDPDDWFVKYLHYRRRLRGDGTGANPGFVSVGEGPGMSLPMMMRYPDEPCDGWNMTGECGLPAAAGSGMIRWADSTQVLGEYLAVLATEHAAFRRVGVDTTQTASDLEYALRALERVDRYAETALGYAQALDGFFIRDDVPAGFHLLPDGRARFPRAAPYTSGYGCTGSVLACAHPVTVQGGTFTSQDQVTGLVWGLALVHGLVPDGVVVRGRDLRASAREAVHRLVWHLRSHGWRVTAPDGTHPDTDWGGNAVGMSNQFAKAANRICGGAFGVSDYRSLESTTTGEAAFQLLLAGWETTFEYNRTMALRTATAAADWDADTMSRRAGGDGRETYALANALLRGDDTQGAGIAGWRLDALLQDAPCAGTCFRTAGCAAPGGWRSWNRWTAARARFGGRHGPPGEYPGMDYLLAHNLWLLLRDGRHDRVVSPAPPADCRGFRGLDAILASPTSGETYDHRDRCARADLGRRFCGRRFAGWIEDVLAGEATVFTAGARWTCSARGPCTLTTGGAVGTAGADLVLGGAAAESWSLGEGDDCAYGNGGADVIRGQAGADEIHGGAGDDQLFGETEGADLSGDVDRLFGDDGQDRIKGGPGHDEVFGGEGNDEILCDAGDDSAEAGPGNDIVRGDAGDDNLFGGPGDDVLVGDAGDDNLRGEEGRDKLAGDAGKDWLWGGPGDNFLKGDAGDDALYAEGAAERLCGNDGDDTLWGNWDGDRCRGGGLFGGQDQVAGCVDDTASQSECGDDAWDAW